MKELRRALLLIVIFIVLLCVAYPAVTTLIATAAFPGKSGGSLIVRSGATVGSSLIGQPFSEPRYFWSRPSATAAAGTAGVPYDPLASGGSNLGPTNPAEIDAVAANIKALRDSGVKGEIPMDLVTASGSGLDPDITIEAALAQVPRVAAARGITEEQIRQKVLDHKQGRTLGFLGTDRVNVLALNMDLDTM